ncbi:MAG TPA: Ltp family lipoprotein [Candidatus Eubacterium faecigallinarum]|nr:Ltp family lipoprotein [Candidatus Eubacterium faecigallinarum]
MGTAMLSGVTEDAINDFSYYEEFDANDYDYNDADDYNYDYNIEEEATQETTSASSSDSSLTLEQQNAIRSVESYLSFTSFSRTGLIDQLEYEGYSTETATFAVDNYNIDWNEQAAKKAQEYLDFSSFSRDELIDQLEYEGFTAEQAEYGVTAVGY